MTTLQDAPVFDQARYDEGRFDGCLEIINGSGDTKIIWDKDNPDEVTVAQASFDAARAKGMSIFTVKGKSGDQDKRIDKFDPKHERLIAVPQMAGG